MNSTSSTSVTSCTFNYPDLTTAVKAVFSATFLLCGILAALGNTIALIILSKPSMRSKSNKFLMSLAVSDALVGLVLCPLTFAALVKSSIMSDCVAEISRVLLSIIFCGVSAITVALIAYDRYVLLSSLNNYNIKMTNRRVFTLIFLSWFLPTLFQSFYVINSFLYLLLLCVLTVGPFILLAFSYLMMARKINEKEKELMSHQTEKRTRQEKRTEKKERKNLKLARKLTLLIVCYILCMFPALVNFLAEIFIRAKNLDKPISLQILTIFSLLCASANSVLNPIIYVSKYPEFKNEFRKLFGCRVAIRHRDSSVHTSFSVQEYTGPQS